VPKQECCAALVPLRSLRRRAEAGRLSREPAVDAIERAREATGIRQMYVELGLLMQNESKEPALLERSRRGDSNSRPLHYE